MKRFSDLGGLALLVVCGSVVSSFWVFFYCRMNPDKGADQIGQYRKIKLVRGGRTGLFDCPVFNTAYQSNIWVYPPDRVIISPNFQRTGIAPGAKLVHTAC